MVAVREAVKLLLAVIDRDQERVAVLEPLLLIVGVNVCVTLIVRDLEDDKLVDGVFDLVSDVDFVFVLETLVEPVLVLVLLMAAVADADRLPEGVDDGLRDRLDVREADCEVEAEADAVIDEVRDADAVTVGD